ncbi:phosphogluconate dehydrogenase (NAD(+)-dependent, decarboxylating) [Fundicoccus culcitae]
MGLNMALNVIDSGWDIVGFDVSPQARANAEENQVNVVDSMDGLIDALDDQKIIFLSTPAGEITDNLIKELSGKLASKDIIIDSGNSNYKDSLKNYAFLKESDIYFIDCGTSGGMEGARNGACLMVGGDEEAVKVVEPFFIDLAIEDGYLFAGAPGTGHYLKMVHNGIEYGMMQSIGEGFDVLNASEFDFDNEKVAKVWNHGSVIRSWLMELMEEGFQKDPQLSGIAGRVDASGEGKWMVEEALELNIPVPVIANSLFVRSASKIDDSFSNKVVATLRHGFGGHAVAKVEEK